MRISGYLASIVEEEKLDAIAYSKDNTKVKSEKTRVWAHRLGYDLVKIALNRDQFQRGGFKRKY
jgi:hypothetical protein